MNIASSLQELLELHFQSKVASLWTAIPARVVSTANISEQKVDVQPAVTRLTDSEAVEYPTILGVPLIFPATSESVINLPVKVGDTVLLIFCKDSIDTFKSGDGEIAVPDSWRHFDYNDAVAIPGLFPFNLQPNKKRILPFNPEALSLTANIGTSNESIVELSEVGVKTQVGTTILNVTPVGVDITGVLTINGVPYIAHTHSGVTTGPGASGPVLI